MGASLLAMAVGQSIFILNDQLPSRAGSLPHWKMGNTNQDNPPTPAPAFASSAPRSSCAE
ncbi:hypothetical protein F7R05_24990 [Pseudomonas koreensis]|nr:hypothetical protein F7R05_24990 [Pseudomonas koreensis]